MLILHSHFLLIYSLQLFVILQPNLHCFVIPCLIFVHSILHPVFFDSIYHFFANESKKIAWNWGIFYLNLSFLSQLTCLVIKFHLTDFELFEKFHMAKAHMVFWALQVREHMSSWLYIYTFPQFTNICKAGS